MDECMLTGESCAIEIAPDTSVIGGDLNKMRSFRFEATRVGEETVRAQSFDRENLPKV